MYIEHICMEIGYVTTIDTLFQFLYKYTVPVGFGIRGPQVCHSQSTRFISLYL